MVEFQSCHQKRDHGGGHGAQQKAGYGDDGILQIEGEEGDVEAEDEHGGEGQRGGIAGEIDLQMHHPFVPEYARRSLLVLDFFQGFCIIKLRGNYGKV